MGIIAAGQITVVDVSDAPVLNAFITASRPTTHSRAKSNMSANEFKRRKSKWELLQRVKLQL